MSPSVNAQVPALQDDGRHVPFIADHPVPRLSLGTRALLVVMAVLDLGWLGYTWLTPPEVFATSPLWVGVLALVPNGSVQLFGSGFGLSGLFLLLLFAQDHPHVVWAGRAALLLGGVTWSTLAGSAGYVAGSLGGLGSGLMLLTGFVASLHIGVLILTTTRR